MTADTYKRHPHTMPMAPPPLPPLAEAMAAWDAAVRHVRPAALPSANAIQNQITARAQTPKPKLRVKRNPNPPTAENIAKRLAAFAAVTAHPNMKYRELAALSGLSASYLCKMKSLMKKEKPE